MIPRQSHLSNSCRYRISPTASRFRSDFPSRALLCLKGNVSTTAVRWNPAGITHVLMNFESRSQASRVNLTRVKGVL